MVDLNFTADLPKFKGLKEMEQRFVVEYVADPKRNGTRAAIRAGYEAGENNASAAVAASRLLRKDKIIAAIKALENKIGGPDCLPRLEAVLNAVIFTDISDVMTWDGEGRVRLLPSDELSPSAAAALAEIKDVHEEPQRRLPGLGDEKEAALMSVKRSVKMHDKLRAVEILARIKGFYAPEKHEVDFQGDMKARLEDARTSLEAC